MRTALALAHIADKAETETETALIKLET